MPKCKRSISARTFTTAPENLLELSKISETKKDLHNRDEDPMLEVHFDEQFSLQNRTNTSIMLQVRVRCWKGSSVRFKDLATFNLELSGGSNGEQTKIQGGPSEYALKCDCMNALIL